MEMEAAIRALSALAQETRLAVFRRLVQAGFGGLPVNKIAEAVGVAGPTLSFHLKELVHAGLVHARQEGRFIYYSANYAAMAELMAFLSENCCGGNPELCTPAADRRPASKRPRKEVANP
ncbi:ArsR/SmtB family transcription factor [Pelomicrobium methylotrophicum]|uniref:Helix-turn-helix transcriptional regulator n=1 Tax=Pelomicrobium methylotrophicum TaxID=2602750 RepID=A0A5C7ESZ5_9PROT|nr:metalloregulator ArsR/SmtB family transcription factor [Pelomicrobium methylotrophicum]TXF10417.1 helix-turn-helix transcriptional regulator [Pelomicrobium methylotrophicum]